MGYLVASEIGNRYSYFEFLVRQERLADSSDYSSFIWLVIGFTSFSAGALWIRAKWHGSGVRQSFAQIDGQRLVAQLTWAFLGTCSVSLLWVGGAIVQLGGIDRLVALAASDNAVARDVVLSASFPGGRLVSSGFLGLAVLSAVLLAGERRTLHLGGRRWQVLAMMIVSLAYLAVIPILVSGRINFFIAVLGAYFAAIYSVKRMVGVRYVIPGVFALAVVWAAKEYFNLGHVSQGVSASDQGWQAAMFYVYNDMLNTLNSLSNFDGRYTWGWYSFRFVFFFTFTDRVFLEWISPDFLYIKSFVTAGEVPMLGAPFVDFGAFGVVALFVIGAITQGCFQRATETISYAAIYGIVASSLILSVHACYLTHSEVVYSAMLIMAITRRSQSRRLLATTSRYERFDK